MPLDFQTLREFHRSFEQIVPVEVNAVFEQLINHVEELTKTQETLIKENGVIWKAIQRLQKEEKRS